jgi:HAMP domain-containing protein
MKLNIRKKLIMAISALVIVLFALVAALFISEKKVEIADDIYHNSLAFARLTAPSVARDYDLYLAESGFVYFNREMQKVFEQNDDVVGISVANFAGEVLYDSVEDSEKQYDGDPRLLEAEWLEQVQSENISLRAVDGRIYYLKFADDGGFDFVNYEEELVSEPEEGLILDSLLVPASEKYSVVYELGYHNMEARVARMMERIIYLALFGIMLGALMAFLLSKQLVKPVKQLVGGVGEIAKGNFDARVAIKTTDEIHYLGEAFNQMAVDLKASLEARVYKEKTAKELELAGQIQSQLIPKVVPEVVGLDLAAEIRPAEEVGGDMYDFLKVSEDKMFMYLGDVTGHGVPAGIVSSISSALFYGYVVEEDLKEIMVKVNRVLKAKTLPTMFMTLALMLWDAATQKFQFVSAGHEQIIHYKAATDEVVLEPSGGLALGMLPDISKQISAVDVDLAEGDVLVVYSDGIPECWRTEKECYGMERFMETVKKHGKLGSATEVKDAILKDVYDYAAGYPQQDDVTILVVRKG